MIIRKLDFLSPSITLYYKGEQSHSSIFSGILTILLCIVCITFGLIYAIQFINKSNPQVYYYNRFVEDAGEFPINASSMFSFIQILDIIKNVPDIIDFQMINIIGIELDIALYHKDKDLSKYNHWIYGPCNNSTDTEGIKELITVDHFTESACIKHYYNKDDKKYYDTNDKNFKWPILLHGCGAPNRTFYGIVVEKCRNTTLKQFGKVCKSNETIIDYISKRSIWLKLIDQYSDMFNYTNPYKKYLYSVSNSLVESTYTINHLNFNPSKIISDEGIFFANKKETLSYFYDLNEKITSPSEDSGIYVAYYFWMQRRMQYYERVYPKFQDFLSNVGGLCSFVLILAEIINFLVNHYIVLFDMKNYMNEIENSTLYNKNLLNIKIDINNSGDINKLYPPKKTNSSKTKLFINETTLFNKDIKLINFDVKESENKNNSYLLNNTPLNKHKLNNNSNNLILNNESFGKNNSNSISYKYSSKSIMKEKMDSQSNINLQDNMNKNIFNNINEERNIEITDQKKANNEIKKTAKLKFIDYLSYLITFKNCHSNIQLYHDFRINMISEENLILSHLNIDKLFQKFRKESSNNINLESEATQKINFNNY